MISPQKIDEWISEVEARPSSASLIIHYIANRLSELTSQNEELLSENISLRSGKKIEDYENRISNLEYQVDLLKRQLGGEVPTSYPEASVETTSLLIYTSQGQVLRIGMDLSSLDSPAQVGTFAGQIPIEGSAPGLLATSSQEELLFLFDSGRTVTMAVSEIPESAPQALDWDEAFVQETRGTEELVTILPMAKMSLYDYCIQTSRRGFTKKFKEALFESFIASSYIGTGVRLPSDRTCSLTLCNQDDLFVMVSQEGFLQSLEVERLPLAIQEGMRLSISDHIITTFVAGKKSSLLVATQNGKAIHRASSWLEPASSAKSQGQPIFSKERRAASVRVIGAAAVDEDDWSLYLDREGKLSTCRVGHLLSTGAFLTGSSQPGLVSIVTR